AGGEPRAWRRSSSVLTCSSSFGGSCSMPRPMKPTGRLVAFLCVAVALGACTGGDGGGDGGPTGSTGPSTIREVPTPAQSFTGAPGTATYEYANEGLLVTVDLDGSDGTLEVE